MGMSKYIRAISNSEKREIAEKTKEQLERLNIQVPHEIYEIIEDDIDIPSKEFNTDYEEIIEIKVKDIPDKVDKIQFVISY